MRRWGYDMALLSLTSKASDIVYSRQAVYIFKLYNIAIFIDCISSFFLLHRSLAGIVCGGLVSCQWGI